MDKINLNDGIYLEDYNLLINWETSQDELINLLSGINYEIELSDRFDYCAINLYSKVFKWDTACLICFHFIDKKLFTINICKQSLDCSVEESFAQTQKHLENVFGKHKTAGGLFTKIFGKRDKVFKWNFKRVKIAHRLFDREGMQESLEIYIK